MGSMESNITMSSENAVSAKMAECFFTINGRRYNFMQMIDFTAEVEKKKASVPILGRPMEGNKTIGLKGTFSGKAHYNQSVMRKAVTDFKNAGQDLYFDVMIRNYDKSAGVGAQTVNIIGCNTDKITLAKFDAAGEWLDETMEGTFEDWDLPEMFQELKGL